MKRNLVFYVALVAIGVICINVTNRNYQRLFDKQNSTINELREDKLELEKQVIELTRLNEQLKDKWTSLGQFKITYYWPGEDEYGDTIARPCSNNHKAVEGHTIAVDPTVIPYGAKVRINGKVYTAEDCGSAVKGKIIDIFVKEPHEDMHYEEVFIKE